MYKDRHSLANKEKPLGLERGTKDVLVASDTWTISDHVCSGDGSAVPKGEPGSGFLPLFRIGNRGLACPVTAGHSQGAPTDGVQQPLALTRGDHLA